MDQAAVLFAYEQIGGCQAAMDMGMSYTKERYAFGRPVASFQTIKHKFADMFVALGIQISWPDDVHDRYEAAGCRSTPH